MPVSAAIIMGGGLTMVGNSPLILLTDLLVAANANLPSVVGTLEPLQMFAPMPIGLALLVAALAYFHFFGHRPLRDATAQCVTPPRTQSYFTPSYVTSAAFFQLPVTPSTPLFVM